MLTIITYDWVPAAPRGYVRDIRVRWACEEAGRPYRVETVPISPKSEAHRQLQPFQQVPALRDGDLTLFESGAIVLHLAQNAPALMPDGAADRARVMQWVIAAMNSVEAATMPWLVTEIFDRNPSGAERWARLMDLRLGQLARALEGRDWLVADRFTAADLVMADALRVVDGHDRLAPYPALAAYLARATTRPGFAKAHADQLAHFAAAGAARTS